MPRFEFISYDVLHDGEGWYVNSAHCTGHIIEIPAKDLEHDATLIKYLKKIGEIRKHVHNSKIEIDGDENVLYFNYLGKPEFEYRRVDDNG